MVVRARGIGIITHVKNLERRPKIGCLDFRYIESSLVASIDSHKHRRSANRFH